MTLGERLREAIGSPVRLLPSVLRLAGDLGVALCDGPHELEAIGELADALGPQETVDLRSGSEVRLHGPIREALLCDACLSFRGFSLASGLRELPLGEGESVLRVVVLLGEYFEVVLEVRRASAWPLRRRFADGAAREERLSTERTTGSAKSTATTSRVIRVRVPVMSSFVRTIERLRLRSRRPRLPGPA